MMLSELHVIKIKRKEDVIGHATERQGRGAILLIEENLVGQVHKA